MTVTRAFGYLLILLAFFGVAMFRAAAAPVQAGRVPEVQDVQSIAAVVNDDIISVFDLLSRIKLVIVSTELEDTPEARQKLVPLVLRSLIDERLEIQEAERLNITVSEAEIANALRRIEEQNNLAEGTLGDHLAEKGVEMRTVRDQVRASIAWRKVVRRRIRPTVDISQEEIEERIKRMEANKDKPQNLVSEIFLAVDSPDQEAEVRRQAERLVKQILNGASFAALARQFSQSASALVGGDIGWVPQGQLDEELDKALAQLEPPALTRPIRTISGYHILALRDRRIPAREAMDSAAVSLTQIFLPLSSGADEGEIAEQKKKANELARRIKTCKEMESVGDELGSPLSGDLGWIKVNDLPQRLRDLTLDLEIGEVSTPVESAEGISIYMVCDRREPERILPNEDEVADALLIDRLDMLARRYLRDLRRAASVDQRL